MTPPEEAPTLQRGRAANHSRGYATPREGSPNDAKQAPSRLIQGQPIVHVSYTRLIVDLSLSASAFAHACLKYLAPGEFSLAYEHYIHDL